MKQIDLSMNQRDTSYDKMETMTYEELEGKTYKELQDEYYQVLPPKRTPLQLIEPIKEVKL